MEVERREPNIELRTLGLYELWNKLRAHKAEGFRGKPGAKYNYPSAFGAKGLQLKYTVGHWTAGIDKHDEALLLSPMYLALSIANRGMANAHNQWRDAYSEIFYSYSNKDMMREVLRTVYNLNHFWAYTQPHKVREGMDKVRTALKPGAGYNG
jgi:hypothetical protein